MRPETGQAVLAALAQQEPAAGRPLSMLANRLVAARIHCPGDARRAGAPAPSLSEAAGRVPPLAHLDAAPPVNLVAGRSVNWPVQALVDPAPGLVQPPAPGGLLGVAMTAAAGVALLGAHGGAGVSCLLRAGLEQAGAVDAGGLWPAVGSVLLVTRTSTHGLERARDLARQHAAGAAGPATRLLGLVLVADAPGRLPARVGELADLVCGAFAHTWQVPWLAEWRLAAAAEPLPAHPEVRRLLADLRAAQRRPG